MNLKPSVHLIAAVAQKSAQWSQQLYENHSVAILVIAVITEIENVLSQWSWWLCGNGVAAIAAILVIGSWVYDYLSKCKIVLYHKTKLWNNSIKTPPSFSLIWNISLTQKCFLDMAGLILIASRMQTELAITKVKSLTSNLAFPSLSC